MYPDRDFNVDENPPASAKDLAQDLNLAPLVDAMSRGDTFIHRVVLTALLHASGDPAVVRFRQDNLDDALANESVVRRLYELAINVAAEQRRHFWMGQQTQPSRIVYRAVQGIQLYLPHLRELKELADEVQDHFVSDGFRALFATLIAELNEDYLDEVAQHTRELAFPEGAFMSVELGPGGNGQNHTLRDPRRRRRGWLGRFTGGGKVYSFSVPSRDEAGFEALTDLLNRGTNSIANEVGQAVDHLSSFFAALRTELAFYVGSLNLRAALHAKDERTCRPSVHRWEEEILEFTDLKDVALTLQGPARVVGNDSRATGCDLIVVTGANSGGKSTYLRSVGLAMLMANAGMFVTASSLSISLHSGLWTHFAREEDETLSKGKFEEEVARMSSIVDGVCPRQWVLLNESFSSTNEREGSSLAEQVINALADSDVRVLLVTHMFDLATALQTRRGDSALFLQATRAVAGSTSYRLVPGEPLPTGFASDIMARLGGFE